jgi:hypothetical protein
MPDENLLSKAEFAGCSLSCQIRETVPDYNRMIDAHAIEVSLRTPAIAD